MSQFLVDLCIITELCTRIRYRTEDEPEWMPFLPVLSILSYWCKAPRVMLGTPVVNTLFKQHRCVTNIFSACVGLPPDGDMLLEHKTHLPKMVF